MKPTPHLIAAALIVLLAAAISLPALLAGGGSYPIGGTVAKVASPVPTLVPSAIAVEPLVGTFERPSEDNPFNLRKTKTRGGPRITLPPPPPLTLPAPPLMPIQGATP